MVISEKGHWDTFVILTLEQSVWKVYLHSMTHPSA
jgi:hypothetical protein